MEDRVTELEIKLTYQERLVETLNQALIEQQAEIDVLKRQLAQLHERLGSVALPDPPDGEPPPHY